jgi:hypothetical protein
MLSGIVRGPSLRWIDGRFVDHFEWQHYGHYDDDTTEHEFG